MTHRISGYIAPIDKLKELAKNYHHMCVIPLQAHDLGFVPLSEDLYNEAVNHKNGKLYFAEKVQGLVAYVETDYFGGFGTQGAVVWQDRKRIYRKEDDGFGCPIDDALKLLGVQRTEAQDEFDVVGLGKYRTNESWLGMDG